MADKVFRWNVREYVAFTLFRLSLRVARELPDGRWAAAYEDMGLTLRYERKRRES